jgi:hypothetical protein
MAGSPWRASARKVIEQAIADASAEGLDAEATLKLIDSRYPFGFRDLWPYQMWLKERKIARQRLGLLPSAPVPSHGCKFCQDQGCLICDAEKGEAVQAARTVRWERER